MFQRRREWLSGAPKGYIAIVYAIQNEAPEQLPPAATSQCSICSPRCVRRKTSVWGQQGGSSYESGDAWNMKGRN